MIADGLDFHNIAELKLRPGGLLELQRFPDEIRSRLGIKGHQRGRFFASRLAGVEIRFVTESPFVRLSLMALQSDTRVMVYRGDFALAHYDLPAGRVTDLVLEPPSQLAHLSDKCYGAGRFSHRVWRVRFHQDAIAGYLGHDSFGEEIRPPQADELPGQRWLAYGSSITFGANALHPATSYVEQAASRLGVDALNLGLPGSCMAEPIMAEYLANRTDADLITCELGVNMVPWMDTEEFNRRIRHLMLTLAERVPDRPVVVLNQFPNRFDISTASDEPLAMRTREFNRAVAQGVADCGRSNLHFLDSRNVLADLLGLSTDLLHPSDEGHIRMGERLAHHLRPFFDVLLDKAAVGKGDNL